MENNTNQNIGWYSEKQRNAIWQVNTRVTKPYCAHVYLLPNGKESIITSVTSSYDNKPNWDDVKLVGPVTKWVRHIYSMHTTFTD
jgi:hypothetical protein